MSDEPPGIRIDVLVEPGSKLPVHVAAAPVHVVKGCGVCPFLYVDHEDVVDWCEHPHRRQAIAQEWCAEASARPANCPGAVTILMEAP